jgi:ornithine carbamoyltransferase
MARHFLSLRDFSTGEINKLIDLALDIKVNPSKYAQVLSGKCVGLFFEKPSLRTKASFYIGSLQLGGQSIYYSPDEVQLGLREKIADVARTSSRFMDAAVLRTFSHEKVLEFAKFSTIPVINALSDLLHPSQTLGDLITMKELKGSIEKLKVAYVGDANNVCNSLMDAFSILGGILYVAAPKGYQPDKKMLDKTKSYCAKSGAQIIITASIEEAAQMSDVLYTDVWVSMGQEKEKAKKKKIFKNFQINDKLLKLAKKDCLVMHCLPAHRGEEITDSAMESKNSVVFLQAENRLYAAKAILTYVFNADNHR